MLSRKYTILNNYSINFVWCSRQDLNPQPFGPKGRPEIVASSTFRIIFYHKISYQKSLNPFIYRHFNHLTLSNDIIQYFPLKIQYKTPHLQKSCIFLAKICSNCIKNILFMILWNIGKFSYDNKRFKQKTNWNK